MGETPQKILDRVRAAKLARRRKLAQLPFEEKIRMVLRMREVSRRLERSRDPWLARYSARSALKE